MSNPYLLPLAMLYVDNRREVDGITRFQKLVFLVQKETDVGELFEFKADKYGPFSKELYKALDELETHDLVDKETRRTRSGHEKLVYTLTGRGQRVVQKQLQERKDVTERILRAAQEIKRRHNDEPLELLLRYVYNKYPDFTGESELLTPDGEIDLDLPSS